MMSTCRACGKQDTFNLELQSDPARATRLLDKLFNVARIHLTLEQTRAICFTCASKIEETYAWLSSVKQYQEEQRMRRNLDARVDRINRTKQVTETIVQEKLWKENLTFNFSYMDDEEEQMPNAQHYISKKNNKKGMHENLNHNKAKFYKENTIDNVEYEKTSSPFSFTPFAMPNDIHENEKITIKPKTQVERKQLEQIEEMLAFNFSQFAGNNEIKKLKTEDIGNKLRKAGKSNIQDDSHTFNFSDPGSPKKEIPFKNLKFSGWNVSRTFKTTDKPTEQRYPYNLRGQKPRDFTETSKDEILKSKVQENAKTLNKPRLRGHESIDIFASQDSYPSAEMFSAGWQLTPDDLIQRVRAKMHKVDF